MIMKRMMMTLVTVWMGIALCSAAMSNSRVRKETRFLTDKMAYELNLSQAQYNDVYEINFDFINGIRYIIDDAMDGYQWALDRYYDCLELRNEDLRWVLNRSQYQRFADRTYFCRPVYATSSSWGFRIYISYTNHNHFFFPKPKIYHTYCGGHHHRAPNHPSYYKGRYDHPHYAPKPQPRAEIRHNALRSDFGRVQVRPDTKQPAADRRRGDSNNSRNGRLERGKREQTKQATRPTSQRESVKQESRQPAKRTEVKHTETRSNERSSTSGNNRSSSRSSSRNSSSRSSSRER